MASIIEMLDKESLRALEQLGRPGVGRVQMREYPPPPPQAYKSRELPQQKKLPYILDVIRDAGYTCIWLGAGIVGSVEAHWTQEEQEIIHLAILDGAYITRQAWYGRWGIVVAC